MKKRLDKIAKQLGHKQDRIYLLDLLDDGNYLDIKTGVIFESLDQIRDSSMIIIDDIPGEEVEVL